MSLNLLSLDAETRALMLEEIDTAIAAIGQEDGLYLGPRLTDKGREDFPGLLRVAAERENEDWLADQLRMDSRLKTKEPRNLKKGVIFADVPYTAPVTLADGEFNYFYIRAICRRAIDAGLASVIVYRAKAVDHPRRESLELLDKPFDPQALLDDLRAHCSVADRMDTAFNLPPGANSGLSVRLPLEG